MGEGKLLGSSVPFKITNGMVTTHKSLVPEIEKDTFIETVATDTVTDIYQRIGTVVDVRSETRMLPFGEDRYLIYWEKEAPGVQKAGKLAFQVLTFKADNSIALSREVEVLLTSAATNPPYAWSFVEGQIAIDSTNADQAMIMLTYVSGTNFDGALQYYHIVYGAKIAESVLTISTYNHIRPSRESSARLSKKAFIKQLHGGWLVCYKMFYYQSSSSQNDNIFFCTFTMDFSNMYINMVSDRYSYRGKREGVDADRDPVGAMHDLQIYGNLVVALASEGPKVSNPYCTLYGVNIGTDLVTPALSELATYQVTYALGETTAVCVEKEGNVFTIVMSSLAWKPVAALIRLNSNNTFDEIAKVELPMVTQDIIACNARKVSNSLFLVEQITETETYLGSKVYRVKVYEGLLSIQNTTITASSIAQATMLKDSEGKVLIHKLLDNIEGQYVGVVKNSSNHKYVVYVNEKDKSVKIGNVGLCNLAVMLYESGDVFLTSGKTIVSYDYGYVSNQPIYGAPIAFKDRVGVQSLSNSNGGLVYLKGRGFIYFRQEGTTLSDQGTLFFVPYTFSKITGLSEMYVKLASNVINGILVDKIKQYQSGRCWVINN